ncbi:MAG: TRASH domain-containing protein [Cyclobacteriaceae bacterium]|nr:TRASH domain-containing protein [Cyclobacteriaceae bacterium]
MKTIKSILIVFALGVIHVSCQSSENTSSQEAVSSEAVATQVPHNSPPAVEASSVDVRLSNELVCMVNDAFMGRKQYPVPVGNKIYYGCCENCVDKLQNSDKYRYGIDPLTNEKVDKVEAYIVLASEETGAVYYFANEENYKEFKSKS